MGADGLRVARAIGQPLSLAYLLAGVGIAELVAGETGRVARAGAELRELTTEHDLSMWRVWADVLCAWARARDGDLDGGLAAARAALEARADIGFLGLQPYFLAVVAEIALDAGRLDLAEALLAEARPLAASSGERIAEPDVERVTGRVARARGDHELAERAFARALARARVIGTPVAALHAARELAELRAAAGCLRRPGRSWPPSSTSCRTRRPGPGSPLRAHCSTAWHPARMHRHRCRVADGIAERQAAARTPGGRSRRERSRSARNAASAPTPPIWCDVIRDCQRIPSTNSPGTAVRLPIVADAAIAADDLGDPQPWVVAPEARRPDDRGDALGHEIDRAHRRRRLNGRDVLARRKRVRVDT